MAITYNDLYLNTRQQLLRQGVPMASLEAREIMRHATDHDRAALARDRYVYVNPDSERRVLALLERRLLGEPIAYLVGEWEFFGLALCVTSDVLIPRVDTEVLADAAIRRLRATARDGARVLDLCAGSGCVGLAIAAYVPGCRVVLADISAGALRVARLNARRLSLNDRVSCVEADALLPAPAALGAFDVIVCNPPYVASKEWDILDSSVKDYEPRLALDGGPDGLRFYRPILSQWRRALKESGRLFFECGAGQAPSVCALFHKEAYGHVDVLPDTAGLDRVVAGAPIWNDAIRDGIAEIE